MNPIKRAAESVGSQAALAEAIGVRQPTVSEWARGDRPIPIERCVDIERATGRTVMRWHLRPTDWHRIWPELIGTEGAPAVPAPRYSVGSGELLTGGFSTSRPGVNPLTGKAW